MKKENYNGWTNWHTWNANLWLNNDHETYKFFINRKYNIVQFILHFQAFLKQINKKFKERIDLKKVNYNEIYNSFYSE